MGTHYVGYINDEQFIKHTTFSEPNKKYPQCVVDRQLGNYFHQEIQIFDPRDTRLQLGGKVVTGKISFHYDGSRHVDEKNPSNDDIFKTIPADHLKGFFNIVETVYLSNGSSVEELEATLTGTPVGTSYIRNTLEISRKAVQGVLYDIDGLTEQTKISMPTWFSFTFTMGENKEYTFKIFTDRDTFMSEYPYSTITNVILPCAHQYLLDPSNLDGTVDAVIKSSEYSFSDIDPSIIIDDHSGLLTYYSKYITTSKNQTTVAQLLPFGILYKGVEPSSLQIREAIRNELLEPGLVSEEVWETILPDIFVVAQFFICPIWDNYTQRANGILYPSVVNAKKYTDVIAELFPSLEKSYIEQYQEMLVCGQSELFLTSIPDPLNKEEFSILAKHPTYQWHMSQEGNAFINQDPATRDFNTRLNRTMSVACDAETHVDVLTQEIDNLTWHSFTSGKTEYHILSQQSYIDFFADK